MYVKLSAALKILENFLFVSKKQSMYEAKREFPEGWRGCIPANRPDLIGIVWICEL